MLETIFMWTGFLALELAMCAVILLCVISARTLIDTVYGKLFDFYFLYQMDSELTYEERQFIKETIKKYR